MRMSFNKTSPVCSEVFVLDVLIFWVSSESLESIFPDIFAAVCYNLRQQSWRDLTAERRSRMFEEISWVKTGDPHQRSLCIGGMPIGLVLVAPEAWGVQPPNSALSEACELLRRQSEVLWNFSLAITDHVLARKIQNTVEDLLVTLVHEEKLPIVCMALRARWTD